MMINQDILTLRITLGKQDRFPCFFQRVIGSLSKNDAILFFSVILSPKGEESRPETQDSLNTHRDASLRSA